MKKRVFSILIIFILLMNGCVVKKEETNATQEDEVVYNLGTFPKDLWVLNSKRLREQDLVLALFEGLVREEEGGIIVPALAEQWNISKDQIQYTFKLREGLQWSNGKSIQAQDFVRLFFDLLTTEKNQYIEELYCIYGVKDFVEGKGTFEQVAIRSVDDTTLEIRLNYPCSYFISLLAHPAFTLRQGKQSMQRWSDEYANIPYSGPFTIKEITAEKEIILVKNKKYWREDAVKSDKIIITTIENEEKALAELEETSTIGTYKVNVMVNPPVSEEGRLRKENKILVFPTQNIMDLHFNLKDEENSEDIHFRKAINAVLSKEYIIQSISKDRAIPASCYVSSDMHQELQTEHTHEITLRTYGNKEEGLKWLRKSKYPKEKIRFIYEKNSFNTRICTAIAENIEEYLDIPVQLQGYGHEALQKVIETGEYELLQEGHIVEYEDSYAFLKTWLSNKKQNIYGYKNRDFDEKIQAALWEKETNKRVQLYKEGEKILLEDLPAIPIYFFNTVICKDPSIKGIYATRRGNIKLDYAYKE